MLLGQEVFKVGQDKHVFIFYVYKLVFRKRDPFFLCLSGYHYVHESLIHVVREYGFSDFFKRMLT